MTAKDDVESYFLTELQDTVTKVKALQTEPCLVFCLCTDVHYASHDTTLFPKTVKNMKAFAEQVRTDGIICLGDMQDGDSTQAVATQRLEAVMPLLKNSGLPVYFAVGNHERNTHGSAANMFSISQIYQKTYAYCENEVFSDMTSNGVNFYKDFDEYKIRMISLDSVNTDSSSASQYKYPANTTTWFASAISGTPSGYTVLLISHMSPTYTHDWKQTAPLNASDVLSAISTWLNASNSNKIISLCGHNHGDNSYTSPYFEIMFNCNKFDSTITQDKTEDGTGNIPAGSKIWKRTWGTVTEDCWDVVVIRPISGKVNCVRFGAGEDREFSY